MKLSLLFMFLLCSWSVSGDTIIVIPEGGMSLEDALAQARDGDTIEIREGIYTIEEPLTIKSRSDLTVNESGEVWLICTDYYAEVIIIEDCTDININNIKARHKEWSQEYECNSPVLQITSSEYIDIHDCELNGCGSIGICVEYSGDVEISGCYIHNNNYCALYFYKTGDISVFNSSIVQNAAFISGYSMGGLEMEGNTIADNNMY